ncbi:hypothetical protein [Asticcacaulis solisilvae]
MKGRELTLEEMLADPIVAQLMARDGVAPDVVRDLMRRVWRRRGGGAA